MMDLKVPKRRVPVSLTLAGGARMHVALFLADAAPGHPGHERLGDLLEEETAFIPALDLEREVITFVHRASLLVAEAAADVDPEPGDDVELPTEFAVEVTLFDGQRLRGLVSYVRPPDRARLVDFLNDGRQFLPLHGEAGMVRLIRKQHVSRVDLLEP